MRLFKSHRLAAILAAVALFALIAGGVYAVFYNLNQSVNSTIVVNEEQKTATLYDSLLCDTPLTGILDFGTGVEGGAVLFKTVYVRTSEINKDTIDVTTDLNEAIATLDFIVGTPTSANAYHGVPVVITLTPLGETGGLRNFHIVVTGHS